MDDVAFSSLSALFPGLLLTLARESRFEMGCLRLPVEIPVKRVKGIREDPLKRTWEVTIAIPKNSIIKDRKNHGFDD